MNKILTAILLVLAVCGACSAIPSTLPSLTIPDCLGVNIHFAGREQAQVDQIAAGGFRFIRMDFVWGAIETKKGVYDFKAYDDLIDSLALRGVRAVFILDYGNGLYGTAPNTTETGRLAFAAFAKAAAAHFKGKGVIWEIWNEPNRINWGAKTDPEDYVKLAKVVYPAVKEADPKSMVVGLSLNRWDYGYAEMAFKHGLLKYVDAVTLHPYAPRQPEDATIFYTRIRALIHKYAPEKSNIPILSGEWGYETSKWGISIDKQAQYLSRMFLTNIMNGCPLSIWYDWRNDGLGNTNGEFNYGVVYNDFKEKPAYIAMKTLSTELNGYSYCKRVYSKANDDYLLLFQKGNDYRMAAWTTGKPHRIQTLMDPDSSSVTIVSAAGEKKQIDIKKRTIVFNLDLKDSVQYIEPNKSALWLYVINNTLTPKKIESARIEALPPINRSLPIEINWPSANLKKTFKGKLVLKNVTGIRLSDNMIPVNIAPRSNKAIARIKLIEQPKSIFSFACSVVDSHGKSIIDMPTKRYQVVETFAGGKPGDAVAGFNAQFNPNGYPSWSDNPKNASGEAKLIYVDAPKGSPMSICGKLDYSLRGARCTALITPTTSITLSNPPRSVKAWIKGDGNDPLLRLKLTDNNDEIFLPDYGILDFTDWRCIEVGMTSTCGDFYGGNRDGIMQLPIKWEELFIIDNIASDTSGTIYLGPVMLCYD